MKFFTAALHATLDAKTGVPTAMDDDEARRRAYACRVMASKYADRGARLLADAYAQRAYTARSAVWR